MTKDTNTKPSPKKKSRPPENPNSGRRSRVRERYKAESGFKNFMPHEVLELVLFGGIPRKNTNILAHNLIAKFGSLHNVFNASLYDLTNCGVPGMTPNAAMYIHAYNELGTYLDKTKSIDEFSIDNFSTVYNYVYTHLSRYNEEHLLLIGLDKNYKLIRSDIIAKGTTDAVTVYMRNVVKFALDCGACVLIMAHNHPSNNVGSSINDDSMTEQALFALAAVGVRLADHIIVGKQYGIYYSYEKDNRINQLLTDSKNTLSNHFITVRESSPQEKDLHNDLHHSEINE